MRVFITIDVEQDCPPFANTYRGMTEGIPKFLKVLEDEKISATFFVTGNMAERHPEVICDIVNRGHEIGCHGNRHIRFDKIDSGMAREDIIEATKILKKFYPISSFRAPYLQFPKPYLKYLSENGYKIDSTLAKHKNPFARLHSINGITRIPVSTTSLILRLPGTIRRIFLKRMKDPIVLFFHPWEFVDLRGERVRFDCRFRTGDNALKALKETIDFYKERVAKFFKMEELTTHGSGWL